MLETEPRLVDPSIQNYLLNTLERCHANRARIYSFILNSVIIVGVLGPILAFLYYAWKKRPTEEEIRKKALADRERVLAHVRMYQQEIDQINSLSGLPVLWRQRGLEEIDFQRRILIP
jgi:hypothetical protein